jgi:hypothetical protein
VLLPLLIPSNAELNRHIPALIASCLSTTAGDTLYHFHCSIPQATPQIERDAIASAVSSTRHTLHFTHPNKYTAYENLATNFHKAIQLHPCSTVHSDLTPLFNTPLNENYFASVLMPNVHQRSLYANLGFDDYFLADTMLLNLEAFRKDGIPTKLRERPAQFSWLDKGDRIVYNYACKGRIARLPPKYNVRIFYGNPEQPSLKYAKEEIQEALEAPVIVSKYPNPDLYFEPLATAKLAQFCKAEGSTYLHIADEAGASAKKAMEGIF